ncbi:MAG: 30S ribosomal protein S17 [candidate division Zixibacteria bacterium]|nr:30S ribosomal protein S17 [candidate division Zixibacteria bacterium]
MEESGRTDRKTRIGIVVSDKMDKTITVKIDRTLMHSQYGRVIRTSAKLLAHDPDGRANVGDRVLVMETRPLSARKRWRLVDVLEKAK